MKGLKSLGLIVIGAAIGVTTTLWVTPAQATPAQAGTRLVITQLGGAQTPSNVPSQALYFVKDTKSSGCWLGSAGVGGGVALTIAPKEACE
jgi:hypothetical protein